MYLYRKNTFIPPYTCILGLEDVDAWAREKVHPSLPAVSSCQELTMGENQTRATGDPSALPGQKLHTCSFPDLF